MGWGWGRHEGYAARRRPDGSLTGTWTAATREFSGYRAVCECGWEGGRDHPPNEDGEDAAYEEWRAEHIAPLANPEPSELLIAARDAGGERLFLDGRPVHAGTTLELRVLAGGRSAAWVPVRIEWGFRDDEPPTAHMALGGSREAEQQREVPQVSFTLPPDAVLRWPEREGAAR